MMKNIPVLLVSTISWKNLPPTHSTQPCRSLQIVIPWIWLSNIRKWLIRILRYVIFLKKLWRSLKHNLHHLLLAYCEHVNWKCSFRVCFIENLNNASMSTSGWECWYSWLDPILACITCLTTYYVFLIFFQIISNDWCCLKTVKHKHKHETWKLCTSVFSF